MKKVLAAGMLVAAVSLCGAAPARAQNASITGRGTYGTATNSYICPAIVMFSHGEIRFDLRVTGKQDGPGEATGTLRATCMGFDTHMDSTPIDTICSQSRLSRGRRSLGDSHHRRRR